MKHIELFDFLRIEEFRLMVDMAKENHDLQDSEDIKARFCRVDPVAFFQLCHEHELDGVVGAYALSLGLELPEVWQKEYDRQLQHLSFLKEKAAAISKIMDDNGISMVILKNGGIMMGLVDNAAKCPMEDIDSLVRKQDFHKAHEILIQNGFVFKFRSEYEAEKLEEAYRDGSTEYYIITPAGEKMWFELAWRAVAGRWIRPDLEPDTDGFMARSKYAGNTKARILSPEDNLLQVCIHTAKHSYVRAPGLRLHMDVDRIVAHENIDWNVFLKAVKATHVKTSTYLSLYIPTVLFGTQVPQYVLTALKPRNEEKLLRMLGKAGLPHPKAPKFGKVSFLLFQTSLYDSILDVFRVLYPGKEWMNERYGCTSWLGRCVKTITRALDLIGIRKKK